VETTKLPPDGTRRNGVTFVQAALFIPFVASATLILWLLAYTLRNLTQHRVNVVEGLDNMEVQRWKGWTPLMAWPPVTCWRGCSDLHRDDWWVAYLDRTCWQGCEGLHRADWWRAYVDQPDEQVNPQS
jgi:hypothetical protein